MAITQTEKGIAVTPVEIKLELPEFICALIEKTENVIMEVLQEHYECDDVTAEYAYDDIHVQADVKRPYESKSISGTLEEPPETDMQILPEHIRIDEKEIMERLKVKMPEIAKSIYVTSSVKEHETKFKEGE